MFESLLGTIYLEVIFITKKKLRQVGNGYWKWMIPQDQKYCLI